jgi:predicted dehydrogenase
MRNRRTTRRQFLNASTKAAALGLAAPYVWSGSVWADESPNEKINVASIGVGGRGTGIGHQAGSLGNMLACADVHRGNAERFAKRYEGKCEIYEDYRRILERKDIDAVTCGTPDHWHTKIAIDAMKAGKDIYCEKPLTLTIDESRQICDVTKRTGRIFQVGTQQRSEYGDMFLKAVAIARSGRLGDKLHAISSVGGATAGGPWPTKPVPDFLNWDFWLGQAPKVEFCPNRLGWNFRWWLEYSGGQVTDWGVHHTDIALWALGGEETGVCEAEGSGEFPGWPEEFTAADLVDFLNGKKQIPNNYNVAQRFDVGMKLPNGNTINLVSKKNELIIEGDKGRIRVNRGSLTGKPVEEIEKDEAEKQRLADEVDKLYRGMPRRGHMGNFFHCIKTREKPISDVWTHCNSVNACHVANIAMFVGEKLRFDTKTWSFDNDTADQFVKRDQRAPYQIKT